MITKTIQTLHFVDDLISYYAEYDSSSEQYNLSLDDLSEVDINNLVSHIMLDDPISAGEAMGPDNDQYDRFVFPALLKHLSNTSSNDYKENYLESMQKSLVSYFDKDMRELIEERLELYNDDRGRSNKFMYNQLIHTGV